MFKTHVESCILKTVEILKYLNWDCFTHFLEIIRCFSKNLLIICGRYSTLDCDNHPTRLKGLNCCTHSCQQNAHLKAWCGYDLKAWHPSDVLAWCGWLGGWMGEWCQVIKRNRDPRWDHTFQWQLEEPPVEDQLHVEVMSRNIGLHMHFKVLYLFSTSLDSNSLLFFLFMY
jgi:hypothetical protein